MYPEKPTEDEKKRMKQLFEAVAATLPCETCRKHFSEAVSKIEPNLKDSATLSKWLVDVHNSVNERLKKPQKSYKQVQDEYKLFCLGDSCPGTVAPGAAATPPDDDIGRKWSWLWLVLFSVLLLLFFILLFRLCSAGSPPPRQNPILSNL